DAYALQNSPHRFVSSFWTASRPNLLLKSQDHYFCKESTGNGMACEDTPTGQSYGGYSTLGNDRGHRGTYFASQSFRARAGRQFGYATAGPAKPGKPGHAGMLP